MYMKQYHHDDYVHKTYEKRRYVKWWSRETLMHISSIVSVIADVVRAQAVETWNRLDKMFM
jgi:hypothetical protein